MGDYYATLVWVTWFHSLPNCCRMGKRPVHLPWRETGQKPSLSLTRYTPQPCVRRTRHVTYVTPALTASLWHNAKREINCYMDICYLLLWDCAIVCFTRVALLLKSPHYRSEITYSIDTKKVWDINFYLLGFEYRIHYSDVLIRNISHNFQDLVNTVQFCPFEWNTEPSHRWNSLVTDAD